MNNKNDKEVIELMDKTISDIGIFLAKRKTLREKTEMSAYIADRCRKMANILEEFNKMWEEQLRGVSGGK